MPHTKTIIKEKKENTKTKQKKKKFEEKSKKVIDIKEGGKKTKELWDKW